MRRLGLVSVALIPCVVGLVVGGSAVLSMASAAPVRAEEPLAGERLRRLQDEIGRLRRELDELSGHELGILGELETLEAELRLRRAQLSEVGLRLEALSTGIETRRQRLAALRQTQQERRRYLAFRLREIYKGGRHEELRRLVGGGQVDAYWSGLRYAAFLSQRDSRVLGAYRADAENLETERAALEARRVELGGVQQELGRKRRRLESIRRERAGLLTQIRDDKSKRQAAIEELRGAAAQLSRLIDSLEYEGDTPTLDVRKFRGLLDWPAAGSVSVAFGTAVHPRFKTEVPHPGLDIEADTGAPIRSIFDGRVVFAEWLRGYGLTAIVDHGAGLLSVYAHASALVVERGERVLRGQLMGQVGETGSLKGPYLYFELRLGGRPTDPVGWLRPR